ncbi:LETM1 domain-containing protein 1 isoform X2 [Periplaneta americana]|uniref:LETM1 domain-containing protein 1 isoform X2 n=1 Tax=Periplaneta americana TaxID=6978 RepID=UPI0037E768E3
MILIHDHQTSEKRKSPKNVKQLALSRYMELVKSYEKVLEKKFPTAMHVYRIFMVGIKEFYRDMKYYFRIHRKLTTSPRGFECLTRKEIELYHQMPKDMIRVAPMLILSTLPFANYIVFPLVYLFPRHLLCHHFWTLQQRMEFAMETQRKKLYNYKPVFRCLQAQLDTLQGRAEHNNWGYVLGLLGSGVHPKPEDIVKSIHLFRGDPYHLAYLYPGHVKGLLRMHSMHMGWRRRHRLAERAQILHEMDMAIEREGGLSNLSQEELRMACFLRGLNPITMKREDMVYWLSQWMSVSKVVDSSSLSLLLHCPILLGYNQPSNWILIH